MKRNPGQFLPEGDTHFWGVRCSPTESTASFLDSAAGFLPGVRLLASSCTSPTGWTEMVTFTQGSGEHPQLCVEAWLLKHRQGDVSGFKIPLLTGRAASFSHLLPAKRQWFPEGLWWDPEWFPVLRQPCLGQWGPCSCWGRRLGGCCREAKSLGKLQKYCKQQMGLIFLLLLTVLSTRLFPKAEHKLSHSPYC